MFEGAGGMGRIDVHAADRVNLGRCDAGPRG